VGNGGLFFQLKGNIQIDMIENQFEQILDFRKNELLKAT